MSRITSLGLRMAALWMIGASTVLADEASSPAPAPTPEPGVTVEFQQLTPEMTMAPVYSTEYYPFSRRDESLSIENPGEVLRIELKVGSSEKPGDIKSGFVRRNTYLLPPQGEKNTNYFAVFARTSRPAYVYVIDFGTSGGIARLFPDAPEQTKLEPDRFLHRDGTQDSFWKVSGPAGTERVLAVAASGDLYEQIEAFVKEFGGDPGQNMDQLARMQDLRDQLTEYCETRKIDLALAAETIQVVDGASPLSSAADPTGVATGAIDPRTAVTGPAVDPAVLGSRAIGLCIGIDRYASSKSGAFHDLTCAVNDATSVRDQLVKTTGTSPEAIRLLTNDQATREGIRGALEWLKSASTGKRVYLYYSGHGVLAEDPSGDDARRHSALVPHDFDIASYGPGKDGGLIYDNEIGRWIDSLECENLVMVFDSCHSGAVTKSIGAGKLVGRGFFLPTTRKAIAVEGREQKAINTEKENAFIIMAAQFDQQAFEDTDTKHGLLTSFLLGNMQQAAFGRELFEKARDFVKDRAAKDQMMQVPVLVDNTGRSDFRPFAVQ